MYSRMTNRFCLKPTLRTSMVITKSQIHLCFVKMMKLNQKSLSFSVIFWRVLKRPAFWICLYYVLIDLFKTKDVFTVSIIVSIRDCVVSHCFYSLNIYKKHTRPTPPTFSQWNSTLFILEAKFLYYHRIATWHLNHLIPTETCMLPKKEREKWTSISELEAFSSRTCSGYVVASMPQIWLEGET